MNQHEMHELLYQALETQQGRVQVYETALRCVVSDKLREEWQEYLDQTRNHVRIVKKFLTTGWTRELWIEALGMPAVLPPPEEEKEVKTAIGAARPKMARKEML